MPITDVSAASSALWDFDYHCRSILSLTNELKEINHRIDTFGSSSASVVIQHNDRSTTYHENHDAELLDLIERKDILEKRYIRHWQQVKQTSGILQKLKLTDDDLRLMYLKYERELPYSSVGTVLQRSVLSIHNQIRSILERYQAEYNRRGYDY